MQQAKRTALLGRCQVMQFAISVDLHLKITHELQEQLAIQQMTINTELLSHMPRRHMATAPARL